MNQQIRIKNKTIGEGHPLFIIAEIGITCNYDVEITKKLIDTAKQANADAVKFIFWFPEEMMSDKTVEFSYQTLEGSKSENMFEMLENYRFTIDQWKEVKDYADQVGIIMFSTIYSPSGIEYTQILGLEACKLSSWDYNYFPLWKKVAKLGKPMIIDTGPVNSKEVEKVIKLMKDEGNEQSILLHCYHTDEFKEINMRAIPYMKKKFNTLVGFSAKDTHDEMDVVALALGSVVLEKRLTLSRSLPGHHHILAKEPDEFVDYVTKMRNVHDALGEFDMKPSQVDLGERRKWFRRIVANKPIAKGSTLTEEMLEGKRPEENGVSPEFLEEFIGKKVIRDIQYNEPVMWEDIQND